MNGDSRRANHFAALTSLTGDDGLRKEVESTPDVIAGLRYVRDEIPPRAANTSVYGNWFCSRFISNVLKTVMLLLCQKIHININIESTSVFLKINALSKI